MSEKKEKLSVYITGRLKRQAKARAALEGDNITNVVERLLNSYVCETQPKNEPLSEAAA